MHDLCRHASNEINTYKKTQNYSVDHYCVFLASDEFNKNDRKHLCSTPCFHPLF